MVLRDEKISLDPGKTVMTLRQQRLPATDFYTYEAEFIPDDITRDPVKQNKRATAFTNVRGKGQVLLIEDQDNPGEFAFLVDRLRAKELQVTVQSTKEMFANLADMQRFDTVVLADAPAEEFTEEQMQMLVRNTQQMGAGLVMLGGPNSFGAGGWTNTPLEAALARRLPDQECEGGPVGRWYAVFGARIGDGGREFLAEENCPQGRSRPSASTTVAACCTGTARPNGSGDPGMSRVGPMRNKMLAKVDQMAPGDMPDFDGPMKVAARAFDAARVARMHFREAHDYHQRWRIPCPRPPRRSKMFKDRKVTISTVADRGPPWWPAQSGRLSDIAEPDRRQVLRHPSRTRLAQMLPRIYQKEARSVSRPPMLEHDGWLSATDQVSA